MNRQIYVAIDEHPQSELLLRTAVSKARDLHCGITVIHVEKPENQRQSTHDDERLLRYLTAAEYRGAEVLRIESPKIAQTIAEVVQQAENNNIHIYTLIIGQTPQEWFYSKLFPTTAEKVSRLLRSTDVAVQVVPLPGKYPRLSWLKRMQPRNISFADGFFAMIVVMGAFALTELLKIAISFTGWNIAAYNVASIFLIAVLISALRLGLLPALTAAIGSVAIMNYFYAEPLSAFDMTHSVERMNLGIFLLSAVIVSLIGSYSRAGSMSAIRNERRSRALFKMHRMASEAATEQEALALLHRELTSILGVQIAFFTPPDTNPKVIQPAYPTKMDLSERARKALEWCWREVRTTGFGATQKYETRWRFEPMVTPYSKRGVLAIQSPLTMRVDPGFGQFIALLADQAATILERIELNQEMSQSHIREEREKLRAMLLSSVSHDLKTPLASVIGSLSVYMRMYRADRLREDTATELVTTALDEAQRLDSFISNILDMTRIESGDVTFNREWVDAIDPVKGAMKKLRTRLRDFELEVVPPVTAIEVEMDATMTEQVLQNLLDNATKYSPPNSRIQISISQRDAGMEYRVHDSGPGIPEEKLNAVFDKYERLKQTDTKVAGTGLGLAICKAIMAEQGGEITARNHEEGGGEFILFFPQARAIQAEMELSC